MKKILSKYNLMTAAALASMSANASIVYTDVDPDETFSQNLDQYDLDLNDDGVIDFTVLNYSYSFSFYGFSIQQNNVYAIPNSGNAIAAGIFTSTYSSNTYTNTSFKPLRANEIVSSNASFIEDYGVLFGALQFGSYGSIINGQFNDTIFDRFMGVKFKESGEDLYGWVRLSVQAGEGSQSFTIYDYAYEDSGAPITAGAGITSPGSVGINEDLVLKNVNAINLDGQLKVTSDDRLNGKVNLINISGQTVKTANINGNELFINSSALAKGTYIVQVIADNRATSIKVTL